MKHIGRLLVLGCAATASLALASIALAKTPELIVNGATALAASATTRIEIAETKTDPAPVRISIYVPAGYTANLSHVPGTEIGAVKSKVQLLAISADTVVDGAGTIVVADATSSSLQSSATECTGAPTHAAIWLLHVVISGQTLDVPVYVDPTTGAEASFSSAKLVLCLPNPYENAVPGTRSPGGAKIFDAKAILSAGVITSPPSAGTYLWRAVVTHWTANGASPNLAGTMEAQGIVPIPSSLSLKANVRTVRHKRHSRRTVANSVLLSGKLLEHLQGVAGARVTLFANGRTAGSIATGSTGSFSTRTKLGKRTTFRATATVPTRETACLSPLSAAFAPAGCAAATIAGYRIRSNGVTATPKKR
jgi:hypothetical protein